MKDSEKLLLAIFADESDEFVEHEYEKVAPLIGKNLLDVAYKVNFHVPLVDSNNTIIDFVFSDTSNKHGAAKYDKRRRVYKLLK